MSCPNYRDYTRDCIKKYPTLVRYENFMKCESEDYQKCIIYHILRSDYQCKYLDSCLKMFPEEIPEFLILISNDTSVYEFITNPVYDYCLSKENNTRCARYKIKEEGKQPPPGLNPDGKNINIADSIIKQKIIIEESVTQNL
jgi:hypothetical protein